MECPNWYANKFCAKSKEQKKNKKNTHGWRLNA